MRRHDTDHAAAPGVETSRNDSQNDVLAGEDAGDARVDVSIRWIRRLHDTDRGGTVFTHETCNVPDSCLGANGRRLCA